MRLPGRVGRGALLEFGDGHRALPHRRVWGQRLVEQLGRDKVAETDLDETKKSCVFNISNLSQGALTLFPLLGVPSAASSSAILLVIGATLESDSADPIFTGELKRKC